MSLNQDCPACMGGNHERHSRDWNIRPGLLGGTSCSCKGGCAEAAERRADKFAQRFGLRAPHGHMSTQKGTKRALGADNSGQLSTTPDNS